MVKNTRKTACMILALALAVLMLASGILALVFHANERSAYEEAVAVYDRAYAKYQTALAAYEEDKDTYLTEDRTALQVEEADNIVYMSIRGYGVIAIKLFPQAAPITVANFKKLVSEGFYDFLTFHRVIEHFMIQGGDPAGDGTGGSDKNITGEFAANGVNNPTKHIAGTISMARPGNNYNGASSQFFIVHETSDQNTLSLDGGYAAFGRVVEGMDIVNAIAGVETNDKDKPLKDVVIRTVTSDREKAATLTKPTEPPRVAKGEYFGTVFVFLGIALGTLALGVVFAVLFIKEHKKEKAILIAEAERAAAARREAQRARCEKRKKK